MLDKKAIADLRQEYTLKTFDEGDLHRDPFAQFDAWFSEAMQAGVNEPNAMTLATVKSNGAPSARIVLLKGFSPDGFVFFTNYDSNKGQQIEANPNVALVFCWLELQRQVRIEGMAHAVSDTVSDEYFMSRPRGSQLGAYASPQSKPINSRAELEENYRRYEALFAKEPIVRPANWGGFNIIPDTIEFWQGRASRLHDRFLYTKTATGWQYARLAP